MKIGGFLKQSLSDFPGQVAAVIFTQGCNLRCPYCHNPELLSLTTSGKISWEDVWDFLKFRQNQLDGVVITGGEPLLQHDIDETLINIQSLGYSIKLDTNGTLPDRLKALLQNQLVDYVAMDLKSSSDLFHKTVGETIPFDNILQSIDIIRTSGIAHEFRSTLVQGIHDLDEISAMAKTIAGADVYFLQTLSGFETLNPEYKQKSAFPKSIMAQFQLVAENHVSQCHLR